MHKSRLGGVIIDCDTDDLQAATDFWAKALGAPAQRAADLSESSYVKLSMPADEPNVEIQKVAHASRVHMLASKSSARSGSKQLKIGWFSRRRPGNDSVSFQSKAQTSPTQRTSGMKKNRRGRQS
jgi:hypothetical protein